MIEDLKLLLGETAQSYTDEQLRVVLNIAKKEVEAYCNRSMDNDLEIAVIQIAVIKLNRLHSEGLSAQSYSGVSESYLDGYPTNIQALLNRKRKVKTL